MRQVLRSLRQGYGNLGQALRDQLPGLILIAVLLFAWQVLASAQPRRYLPEFLTVAATVWEIATGPRLITDVLPSLVRAMAGLAIATIVGIIVGIVLGHVRSLEPYARPVLEFGRAVPAPALLSGAIILLGTGARMRISLIAFACLFPILWNAMDGAKRIEAERIEAARMCGLGTPQLLIRVVLPSAAPDIFAGIRISLGIALIVMVISEIVAAQHGLGAMIFQSQRLFRVADTYAGVLLLGLIGWILNSMFLKMEGRILAWHRGWRSSR